MRLIFTLILATSSILDAAPPTGRYKDVIDKMKMLSAKYPQFTSVFSLGQNDDSVDILAMRISVTPTAVDPKKVGHLLVSTHHGNESATPVFTLYFTEELLKRYASHELFRTNLSDTEWTIIPVLNISGFNANNRQEHGYDPNRDYPGPCTTQTGGKLKSISLLIKHLQSRVYTGSLTVHGYYGSLTYPWGVSTANTHSLDHNAFEKIVSKATSLNGYVFGTSTDVIYPCDGSFEDYTYWKHGIWSLLLELKTGSQTDIPPTASAVAAYFDQIDSTPSSKNQMTGQCTRARKPDLHNE